MYRTHTYVERCHCNEAAIAGCASCGRARCARHLERRLCNRCTQFIDHELELRASGRKVTASGIGAASFFALLVTAPLAALAAVPVWAAAWLGHRVVQRQWLIRRMGPALSASTGELPAVVIRDTPQFPSASALY